MGSFEVIKVPAPKEVGEVNCILVKGDRPVLIDPGPETEEAFEAVEEGVRNAGYEMGDVDKVLVTHPHSDHFGNARNVREVSGADICMHADSADIVEDFINYRQRQIDFFSEYFDRMGMSGEIESILERGLPNTYRDDLRVDRRLSDGEIVKSGDLELQCTGVRGHAKGSMCFEIREGDTVFTGDFMLPDITPNPMLMLPDEGRNPPSSLHLYLNSLEEFLESDKNGYGGHEGVIENVGERTDEIIDHHHERKENILETMDGQRTAFQIMQNFFGGLPEKQYFLGMAEIISHLRLLEKEERVKRREEDGIVLFEQV